MQEIIYRFHTFGKKKKKNPSRNNLSLAKPQKIDMIKTFRREQNKKWIRNKNIHNSIQNCYQPKYSNELLFIYHSMNLEFSFSDYLHLRHVKDENLSNCFMFFGFQ